MRKWLATAIAMLMALSLYAAADYRGFTLESVEVDGRTVPYWIHVGPGAGPHGLFVTLPGYEGLWFQGEAQNLRSEDFSFEALEHDPSLIVVAPQLMDWRERSAREVIAITEHVIASYDVDTSRVYLEGFSGGGETGSLVMGMKPGLYTAFLAVSTRWDGDLEVLADSRTPVYLAVGEDDSYYGSGPLKRAYDELVDIYSDMGVPSEDIDSLVVLDVRDDEFFRSHGYADPHAGGNAFAFDEAVMGWLFGPHPDV